jgi:hypothetical protein
MLTTEHFETENHNLKNENKYYLQKDTRHTTVNVECLIDLVMYEINKILMVVINDLNV